MSREPAFEIRHSSIEGLGAFARRRIRKGDRITEYVGERISQDEADRRYEGGPAEHPRVLLFNVDEQTVIDAGVEGNDARFINHSCEPNCESVVRRKRVWILALREIQAGEELTYDYNLTGEGLALSEQKALYPCHCGSKACRGTLYKVG